MNKIKTLIQLSILLIIILILGISYRFVYQKIKSGADLLTPKITNLFENNPQIIPTQTGYLFEIKLDNIPQLVTSNIPNTCYNNNNLSLLDSIIWTASAGRFDSPKVFNGRLVALYHSPNYPIQNVQVKAQLKKDSKIFSTISFDVKDIDLSLDQKPYPHIAKHRIKPAVGINGQIAQASVKYLEKYPKITVEGDNLAEAALVKSQKSNLINVRFVQSGTEIASRTFLLGLNPTTFLPATYQEGDPIDPLWLDQGKAYADQPWWGHLIYNIGAPLAEDLQKPVNNIYEHLEVKFTGDVSNIYQPGQYLIFFDKKDDSSHPTKLFDNNNIEMVRILPAINSKGLAPIVYNSSTNQTTVNIESRGINTVFISDTNVSTATEFIYTKTSLHQAGTMVRALSVPKNYPGGFRYNFAHFSQKSNLKNPEELDSHDWLILYLIHKLNRDLYTDYEYPAIMMNGWQFDVMGYWTSQVIDNSQLVDLDLDNQADGGFNYLEYPEGQDVLGEGRLAFFHKLRNWAGKNRLIIGDNATNRGYDSLNGTEFEGFPHFLQGNSDRSIPEYIAGFNAQLNYYKHLWTNIRINLNNPLYTELFTKRTNAIFYNTSDPVTNPEISDLVRKQPTNNLFRLDMAAALLSNGYYIYGQHPFSHINLTDSWLDEFDGGLGSSLKKDVPRLVKKANRNKIYAFDEVYEAYSGQFQPTEKWLIGQEVIEVVAFEKIGQDSENNNLIYGKLSVYRARDNSNPIEHPRGTKLIKLSEVDQAGIGYLGQPLSDAQNLSNLNSTNVLVNGNFDNQTTGWNYSTDTTITAYSDRSPNHPTALEVKSTKLTTLVNPASPIQGFNDPNISINQEIVLKRNTEYTLSFYARADRKRNLAPSLIRKKTESLTEFEVPIDNIDIYPYWKEYKISFVTPKGNQIYNNYSFTISGYKEYNTFSLDDVSINKGGWQIYQRDFENGLVLINGSNSDVVFNLPTDQIFQKIKGTQDYKINDGSAVSGQYTVPIRDAIILLKQ